MSVRVRRLPGLRGWLIEHLPAGVIVRPLEWFLAVACVLSGLLILTGLAEPRAAYSILPPFAYYLWGASLVFGSLFLMCGLSSIRWTIIPDQYITRRVPCYRLGLRLLGMSGALLATAQMVFAGLDALPSAGITLYFSISCGIRLLTLRGPGDE